MSMVVASWPTGVRKRVMRDTTWEIPTGTIADDTRCGRKKVRASASLAPETFSVAMNFTHEEYVIFKDWFKRVLRHGAIPFYYPAVDMIRTIGEEDVVYRFTPGSSLNPDNPGGKIVHVSMQWEEV